MRCFGLIGKNITHSFSKKYFEEKFKRENLSNYKYINFNIETLSRPVLNQIIKRNNLSGLNVTSPYKERIVPYLDKLSDEAENIKSVNTIKIIDNNLFGYNTDIIGFKESFLPLAEKQEKILILGNGGASKAVQFILKEANYNYKIVSRKSCFNYTKITNDIIKRYSIIINTTNLGMYPNIKTYPKLPYKQLNTKHLLFDLVYNPEETLFLKFGRINNARTKNGMEMLLSQAEASWEIWNS